MNRQLKDLINRVLNSVETLLREAYQETRSRELKDERQAFDTFLAEFQAGQSIEDIRSEYQATIMGAMEEYLMSERPITAFRNEFRRAVDESFTFAFVAGYADAGGATEEMPQEAKDWVIGRIEEEIVYANELFTDLAAMRRDTEMPMDVKFDKALWHSENYAQTLDTVYDQGRLWALKNIMLSFTGIDGKVSCETCQAMKGKRMPASWWIQNNLVPGYGNNNYICGGYHCFHFLQDDKGNVYANEAQVGTIGLLSPDLVEAVKVLHKAGRGQEAWILSRAALDEGGSGSGHWGHAGVPGQYGGSAPGSGGGGDKERGRGFNGEVKIKDSGPEARAESDGSISINKNKWIQLRTNTQKFVIGHEIVHQTVEEYILHNNDEWDKAEKILLVNTDRNGNKWFLGGHNKIGESISDIIAARLINDTIPGATDTTWKWADDVIKLSGYDAERLNKDINRIIDEINKKLK